MAELQHTQIRLKLLELVAPFVDTADIKSTKSDEHEKHVLSRCIAAAAIRICCGIEYSNAASAIVDGGGDNGIDALYYDIQRKFLYVVQSKWSAQHGSSIAAGDVLKFLKGIRDLISLKKERFNKKITNRWELIGGLSR
jgi:hypothetical protein